MSWQVFKESLLLFIASGIGIYLFKRFNTFFKLHSILVIFALIVDLAATSLIAYQKNHGLDQNNGWLYNIYILIEGFLLIGAGFVYFKQKQNQYWFILFPLIYIGGFLTEIILKGYLQFANYSFLVEGILVILIYLLIMFYSISPDNSINKLSSEFWLSLGLLIYFACNAPYFGPLHYLEKYWPELSKKLFLIPSILSNIRYFFVALSFYLYTRYQNNEYKPI